MGLRPHILMEVKLRITRKEINNTSDGSIELFEISNEYVASSVLALELSGPSIVNRTVIELGGKFVQITPAPNNPILFIYDIDSEDIVNAEDIVSGLSPWDSKRVVTLMQLINELQGSVSLLEKYLLERLSKEEFNSWAAVMEKRFDEIQSQL